MKKSMFKLGKKLENNEIQIFIFYKISFSFQRKKKSVLATVIVLNI